jgi:putative lipoic acid-binding regulatory protein
MVKKESKKELITRLWKSSGKGEYVSVKNLRENLNLR